MRSTIKALLASAAFIAACAAALLQTSAQEPLYPVQARGRARARGAGTGNSTPPEAPEKTSRDFAEEGMRLFHGSTDGILALSFSPDGKLLASACADHTITLWDVASGNPVKKLEGHSDGVMSLAFSPDGKKLVSGGMDSLIDVWNISTGTIDARWNYGVPVLHLAFLNDSVRFAAAWNQDMTIFDPVGHNDLTCTCDGPVRSIVVSPEGNIITGDQSAGLIVWNPKTGEQIAHFTRPRATRWMTHDEGDNWTMGLSLMPDGKILLDDISGFWTWDRKTNDFTLIGKNLYNLAGPIGDGSLYCGGSDGKSIWFRETKPDGISLMLDQNFKIHDIAISPKRDLIAFSGGGEWTVPDSYWRTAGPMDIRVMNADSIVQAMAFEKDKKKAWLETAKTTDPSAVLDSSAINPGDGPPLPWAKKELAKEN